MRGARINVASGKDCNGRVLAPSLREVLVLCHPEWCDLSQCDIQAKHWDYAIRENGWDNEGSIQVQTVRVPSVKYPSNVGFRPLYLRILSIGQEP